MKRADSRRLSIGAVLSGAVLALGAIATFSITVFLVLLAAGMEPETLRKGDFSLTLTIGLTFTAVVAIFLAFVWGGYVSARLAAGGIGHGIATPMATLILGFLAWTFLVLSRTPQRLGLPFTPATLRTSLKEGFSALIAIGGTLALVAQIIAGAVGGIYARRRAILLTEDRFQPANDFFEAAAEPPPAPIDGGGVPVPPARVTSEIPPETKTL